MFPSSMQLSNSATGKLDSSGTYNQASGSGDWNVVFNAPSATDHADEGVFGALASPMLKASASVSPLLLLLIAGAVWLILKK